MYYSLISIYFLTTMFTMFVQYVVMWFDILNSILSGILSEFLNIYVNRTARTSIAQQVVSRLYKQKIPPGLPHVDPMEKVSDRVYRIIGFNPGAHTLQGTNTYLIGMTSSKMLIDTGEDITSKRYVQFLFDTIFPVSGTEMISAILLTHGHFDHQGGVIAILKECEKRQLPKPKVYKRIVDDGKYPCDGYECHHIDNGAVFQADEGTTIRAVYSPGHTDDHVAFILEEDRALISGDCVLGCGTTVFDDLHAYMLSLHHLRQYMLLYDKQPHHDHDHHVSSLVHIYPGHGPIIRDKALAKVDEYIHHRQQREQQIMDAMTVYHYSSEQTHMMKSIGLASQCGWMSSWELVAKVYGPLSFHIKLSALWNLTHHLEKLKKEEKIDYKYPAQWRIKAQVKEARTMVCDGETCQWVPKQS